MSDSLFEKDLGLELLMNPKKKASSDNVSVSSQSYHGGDGDQSDASSVKSINVQTNVVDIRGMSQDPEIYAGDTEEDSESLASSIRSEPQYIRTNVGNQNFARNNMPAFDARSDGSESDGGRGGYGMSVQPPRRMGMSEDEILNAKRELLYQFDRLEKKGVRLPRKFTLASNLDEMKAELGRLRRDREVDNSIKFQRKVVMTTVAGVELLNNYFNPVNAKLDGWSDSINENIDDYDDVFEELHEKYKGKAKMAPELKLLFMLGGSAFMYHMTNSMFKTSMPGLDQVLKQNPELMRQFAAATANTMAQDKSNPVQSGLGGMFSNLFSGNLGGLFGGGGGAPPQGFSQPSRAEADVAMNMEMPKNTMRGPTNVDDILREIDGSVDDNERIEMLSTVTESELADIADDASINNLLMNKKKPQRKKITLDL